ncbi:small subunit ribosomal protein S6 [Roseimicrobium gellanilyticum]|jgi:small subunit ribosomal protein S6|uniref:Small ribosomal subunit protein bS6 n=1 Tax=Roseimicrobium gellanilyticum TaxID=748857 RepID=A0A366HHC1_9BACT|nr:30S ribosomal protein S6 [Roseimicrobium gellanilyticum]RBP41326.1 small subunit ribosomal protein S6 [Roseimicrobium gellanilyticum]
MSRKYEAMIVLDMKGREENVETLVSQLGKEFESNGVKLQQVDNLGKKKFPFAPRHVESGYYINFLFEAEPAAVDKVQARLKLNDNVYMQYFQRR